MPFNNSKNSVFISNSADETFEIGYKIGKNAKPGEIYALYADMGMGKTVFAKGFARGLMIDENVNSPTFTIVREYHSGRLPFYHFDVYRIEDIDEMQEIGYCDYFYSEGVCLIEWASLIKELLPEYTQIIYINRNGEDLNSREIVVEKGENREDISL